MKWLTFAAEDGARHGWLAGEDVVVTGRGDLSAVVAGAREHPEIDRVPLAGLSLLPPLLFPGKVIAAAANYQAHITESGAAARDTRTASPRLFLKPVTSLIGHQTPVELDPITHELDWEVELAVVIGSTTRRVDRDHALSHVFGYATSNDLSARSLDLGTERDAEAVTTFFDWLEGKWLDGSAPMGPWLVTADEVPDPQDLELTLSVNEVSRQAGSTAQMIHDVADLVAFSSRLMTLQPGDVLLTGTPAGVGAATGTFLKPGDQVVAEIAGLGQLHTPIVAAT